MRNKNFALQTFGICFLILSLISCSIYKTDKKLNGKTPEFLIEKFGTPQSNEDRIITVNKFTNEQFFKNHPFPIGQDIQIKEIFWRLPEKKMKIHVVFIKENGIWISIKNTYWDPSRHRP